MITDNQIKKLTIADICRIIQRLGEYGVDVYFHIEPNRRTENKPVKSEEDVP